MSTSNYKYKGVDLFDLFSMTDPPPKSSTGVFFDVVGPNTSNTQFRNNGDAMQGSKEVNEDLCGDYLREIVIGSSDYVPVPFFIQGTSIDKNLMMSYKTHDVSTTSTAVAPPQGGMTNVNGIHYLLVGGGGGFGGNGGNAKVKYASSNKATGHGGTGGFGGQGARIVHKLSRNDSTVDFANLSINIGASGASGVKGGDKSHNYTSGSHTNHGHDGGAGTAGGDTTLIDTIDTATVITTAAGGGGGKGGKGASAYFHSSLTLNSHPGDRGDQGSPLAVSTPLYGTGVDYNYNNTYPKWTGNQGDVFQKYGGGGYQHTNANGDHNNNLTGNNTQQLSGSAVVVFLYD